jgi:hypothetical protein
MIKLLENTTIDSYNYKQSTYKLWNYILKSIH